MDTGTIRAQARQFELGAEEVREQARRLVAAGTVHWRSAAADRFRSRLGERYEQLRRSADALEEAASALRRYAAELDAAPAGPAALVSRLLP